MRDTNSVSPEASAKSGVSGLFFVRVGLSLLILFHLVAIVVLPNRLSVVSRAILPYFTPYIELFEFTANWNFFAPEPGPPPFRLEWEALDREGNFIENGGFPSSTPKYFLSDRLVRRRAIARFMAVDERAYVRVWPDYVCRQDPRIRSVRLWRVTLDVPRVEEVLAGEKNLKHPEVAERASAGLRFCEGESS